MDNQQTTAAVFARICGLTPEAHEWAYGCPECRGPFAALNDTEYECWPNPHVFTHPKLTATSPLAEAPTAGWLEALVRHAAFDGLGINDFGKGFFAQSKKELGRAAGPYATHPTHAVALALVAADPALKAELQACSDAGNYEALK